MNSARLLLRQLRYDNRAFWRNSTAAFFTFVFPLMFLVIFSLAWGNGWVGISSNRSVRASTYYVPGISTFSVITACYTNLAMSISVHRGAGILKRVRGTPLPPWVYLASRVLYSVAIAVLLVAICVAFGAVFYGVDVPTRTLPAFLLSLTLGAAAFSALGLAITGFIPSAEAASPIVNASILPLMFFSNVFFPLGAAPAWIDALGKVFPVRHFADAMSGAFLAVHGNGLHGPDLLVILAWGAGGLLLALRFFSWEPRA